MSTPEIEHLNEILFKPQGKVINNIVAEPESKEYLAHTFLLTGKKSIFRKAKITPTKIGQFVAIWKRNPEGITAPYSIFDPLEFMFIMTQKGNLSGVFIFPKSALHQNKILSDESKDGKRGIRVYPPWDIPTSKQAMKTQTWQNEFFIDLNNPQLDQARQSKLLTDIFQ